jgi:zinc protease
VLAVFGDVDAQAVIEAAREQFGQMPRQPARPVEAKKHRPVEPRIVQSRTTKPVVGVQVGFGPGMARNNPDYAPMLVMTRVASSFPTGWLEQALRGEGPGLVYAVGAFAATGYVPGYWAAIFNTQPATAEQAVGRTLTVIERLRSEPVDQATLERARQATLVREALGSQSNSQRAAQAALDALYGVGHDGPDDLIRQIRGVTAADVRRVAEQYLAHPLLVLISPEAVDLSTVNLNAEPADAAGD